MHILTSWPWMVLAVEFGDDGGVGAGPGLTFSNSHDRDTLCARISWLKISNLICNVTFQCPKSFAHLLF